MILRAQGESTLSICLNIVSQQASTHVWFVGYCTCMGVCKTVLHLFMVGLIFIPLVLQARCLKR